MRSILVLASTCCIAISGLSQGAQTVILVFVTPTNTNYKNFEAVIDEVSYYSEDTPGSSRNTIWLNNMQAGRHSIQVYSVRNGSGDERADTRPVFSSDFTVRNGFDTKIAVKTNGQVQFSERLSTNNETRNNSQRDNSVYEPSDNNSVSINDANPNINQDTDDNTNHANQDPDLPAANGTQDNDDTFNNQTHDITVRHSRKRMDTALILGNINNTPENMDGNTQMSHKTVNDSNATSGADNGDDDGNRPMSDSKFDHLYESVRNQWLPGQRMKTLTNEFLNTGDKFTTSQATRLIQLVTYEDNRVKLAKLSCRCVTDPENFNEIKEILRTQASRNELDDFMKNGNDDQ
jgi:Domain of unknown function (DUF4476)